MERIQRLGAFGRGCAEAFGVLPPQRVWRAMTFSEDIRAVIFDLGGVLVEFRGVTTLAGWMDNGISPEEIWRLWLSSSGVREFETGMSAPDEFARKVVAEFRLRIDLKSFSLRSAAGRPAHSLERPSS